MSFLYRRKSCKKSKSLNMRLTCVSRRLIRTIAGIVLVLMLPAFLYGCGEESTEASVVNEETPEESQPIKYIYGIPMDEDAAVGTESVADVYERPDVTSTRLTQVLCNQPVSILESDGGWSRVKTVSGITGWIRSKYLSGDVSSISGRVFTYRIIVTSREKTVYSGPNGGITMVNAQMGTEFYAFNNTDDAYEVFLPKNKTGWLKGSGIIRIPVDDAIPVTNADDFASTALKFKGTSFMLNGLSSMGIDAPGLVFISARINGINLPITLEGQMKAGREIDISETKAGDLVFLSKQRDNETAEAGGQEDADQDDEDDEDIEDLGISSVGVCIGGGSYIYAGRKTGYAAIGDLYRENPDGIVVHARRIFN